LVWDTAPQSTKRQDMYVIRGHGPLGPPWLRLCTDVPRGSSTDAESMRSPKSPNNVANIFFNTVHLLPAGAKRISCPGRHLTSVRPWFHAQSFEGPCPCTSNLSIWIASPQEIGKPSTPNQVATNTSFCQEWSVSCYCGHSCVEIFHCAEDRKKRTTA